MKKIKTSLTSRHQKGHPKNSRPNQAAWHVAGGMAEEKEGEGSPQPEKKQMMRRRKQMLWSGCKKSWLSWKAWGSRTARSVRKHDKEAWRQRRTLGYRLNLSLFVWWPCQRPIYILYILYLLSFMLPNYQCWQFGFIYSVTSLPLFNETTVWHPEIASCNDLFNN